MDDVDFNELTMRGLMELPEIPLDYKGAGECQVIGIEFFGDIGNPMFIARYVAWLVFGDLGYYRYGPITQQLWPKHDGGRRKQGATLQ